MEDMTMKGIQMSQMAARAAGFKEMLKRGVDPHDLTIAVLESMLTALGDLMGCIPQAEFSRDNQWRIIAAHQSIESAMLLMRIDRSGSGLQTPDLSPDDMREILNLMERLVDDASSDDD